MSEETVIRVKDVWKIFGARAQEAMTTVKAEGIGKPEVLERFGCVVGVQGASFEVPRGEIFCIMGLSGSGKSTLVRHVNRLIEPTAGSIEILGRDVASMSETELRHTRARQIGMVFQHMALMPHRSVRDNVAYPLEIRKVPKSRRWAISDPEILLMDEPFSALDPLIRMQLQDQFKALVAQLRKTTLFITHDLDEAIRIGHRIAIMKDGVIVQIGTPEEIVMNPADDHVREFVQGISKLKLVKAHSIMEPIEKFRQSFDGSLDDAPRADENADLDQLIDLSVGTYSPIVITENGQDVGVVNKARLLRGIQGGKDE